MRPAAGFDFVLVDNQHGDWDDATTLAAFRAISLGNATPVARVRQNDFYAIGRLLDRGALGIVVPMVNSADEARAAAFAMRYPPYGGRSYAGSLAVHYGPDYDTWADREVFLAVQIETAQAAEHAEEIMAVEGVDGCWIGPMDLARSLGVGVGHAGAPGGRPERAGCLPQDRQDPGHLHPQRSDRPPQDRAGLPVRHRGR